MGVTVFARTRIEAGVFPQGSLLVCDTPDDLPMTGLHVGDKALVLSTGAKYYCYNGTSWTAEGGGGPHTHPESEIIGLVSDLAGKASQDHNHDSAYDALGAASSAVSAHDGVSSPHASATSIGGKAIPGGGIADASTLSAHTEASAPHSGHVQIGGQLGGTASSPDVRGLRETGGPTLLTLGAITDGQYLKRSGTSIVGDTPSGGGGLGYCMDLNCPNQATTTDGQTVYWGGLNLAQQTTADIHRAYIPKAGTIKAVYIYVHSGTAGSGEAWSMYIRLNNATDYLIQTVSLANAQRVWSNTSLSIAVNAGDFFCIKEVEPTWATNPANVRRCASIYIE